jgi:BNR/Asp-box repeat.
MSGEPITRDMTGEEVYAALYSMRSSRLEPGVFWTGSNDGPVWMTRDNGKTWKNVTPPMPPGGASTRSKIRRTAKGSAYVSVYRMYMNDFKPYLYMTNDYGAHWTLLTDGNNGIPSDQPMHVVREDPEQEGLLYAGTLQGAFVSFDQGKHWQTLQQNLPATPVTDFKVHHGDLLARRWGARSGSWTTSRRCADRRQRDEADPSRVPPTTRTGSPRPVVSGFSRTMSCWRRSSRRNRWPRRSRLKRLRWRTRRRRAW